MSDIAAWLESLGLAQFAELFRENLIDHEVLVELTDADLKELGLPLGARKKILKATLTLGRTVEEATAAAPLPAAAADPRTADSAAVPTARPTEAERRQLTVLFCDLVGSTALSARLDPEDMQGIIKGYQDACAGVITRFEGHVAKFMGDGVLAYFGWPRAHEDEAERAVRAGLSIVEAVATLSAPGLAEAGAVGGLAAAGRPLAARVGIATGLVVVGDLIGEGAAREEAVVGETPNLAARLQALAEPGQVVIAPSTQHLLGGLFELADLGARELKGLPAPVQAWAVVGEGHAVSRFEARRGGHLTPLVGRDEELGLLLSRWRRATEGEAQVVLLSGEPGIGKSRITEALRERLAIEPHHELRYFCSPFHTNSSLHPVLEQLVRAAGFDRDDGDDAKLDKLEALLARGSKAVAETAALLAPLLSIAAGHRYPSMDVAPQRRKQRTLQLLTEQVAGLAADRPVVIILEDAHWLDPSTRELFDLIIERLVGLPVLLLVTFRPEFSPPWLGHAHVTQLSLTRLGQRHGSAMVAGVIGNKALPPEVLNQIVARTDGVPLFVEELTKTVLESGLLRDLGDHYELTGPLPAVAIPSTLQDSLMARLDRLAPVKEVAQIGAAIGRQFPHDLLAAVAPLDADHLGSALGRLVDAELVFRRGTPPDAVYTFKHALVQDAAYQSLLKSTRAELHHRIAKALETHFPAIVEGQPETVAHHYAEAGLARQAVTYWLRAGELAAGRSAHLEAVAHLRCGLGMLSEIADEAERNRIEIDLLVALGVSSLATKGFAAPETGEAYSRAEQLCKASGETSRLSAIGQGLYNYRLVRGEVERARQLAEGLLAMANEEGRVEHLIAAHHAMAGSSLLIGAFDGAREHFERALRYSEQMPDRALTSLIGADLRVFMRAFGCHALWHLGLVDQAKHWNDEAIVISRAATDSFSLAIALCYGAMLSQFARDARSAEILAVEAIALCREQHFAYYLAWAQIIHGWAQSAQGWSTDGIAEMERGLAEIDATGGRLRHGYYLSRLAEAHGWAGDPDKAVEILDQAIALSDRMGDHWRDADLHRLKGVLALGLDRAGEAEATFQQALAIAREQGARSLELQAALDLAKLWSDQGRGVEARALLAPIHAAFTEGFETRDLKEAKAMLDELA